MAHLNHNIHTLMKPRIDEYNAANEKYSKLLIATSVKWKRHKQMDETIFDNITDAIAETVRTANLMMTDAQAYMDRDIDLANHAHSQYYDIFEPSSGSIIEVSGRYFDILKNRNDMMRHRAKTVAISKKMYNIALDCHNTAVLNQTWWNNLMPILKEENKTKPKSSIVRGWIEDFQDNKQPDATYDATKALNDARGRHKKSKRRQGKPKKKQTKSK
jgi:hypothetical protein